jgi:Zn-dependent protease
MNPLFASVNFSDPFLWAVVVGWVLSVVLHEFAHGIVAYWGGDYTIRERGGLTLNPLQYIDPIYSVVVPVIILLIGGIPLPGGVTYVRRDLIRSRWWDIAVSLAGPLMNGLIGLVCIILLSPKVGWANYTVLPTQWSPAERFVACTAILQTTAMCINLLPLPPLDGFQAIMWFLPRSVVTLLSEPGIYIMVQVVTFVVLMNSSIVSRVLEYVTVPLMHLCGSDDFRLLWIANAYDSLFK